MRRDASVDAPPVIDWGVATLALAGEMESGDPHLVTRGGIVGGTTLPPLRPDVVSIARGDLLIFATDGIRGGFTEGLPTDATPQQLADEILARYGKGTDDALVLVARYAGGGSGRA